MTSKENLDLLEHSPTGPSAASIWINCTASLKAQEGLPDNETRFAAEGTAAHMLAEWCRIEQKPAENWLGHVITFPNRTTGEDWEFIVDKPFAHAVNEFLDYVNGIPGRPFYEERVHYFEFISKGFGTADDIRLNDGTCYITDLKFGKGVPVAAEWNYQLMMYAVGVMCEFRLFYDITDFVLTICQPRIGILDTWTVTIEELQKWLHEVAMPASEIALAGKGVFKAGDHCRWCRAKDLCKARAKHMLDLMAFDQMDAQPLLDPMAIAEILPHTGAIKAWCNDIEAKAEALIQARQKVGGWKLVRGRRSKKYIMSEEEAVKLLRSKGKLKIDEVSPRVVISPAAAVNLLGKKHPLVSKLIRWTQGKPVLAPPDDNRDSIQPKIDFEDLT